MAIDRNDTDSTFDKLISPTLKSKRVAPIRVDRIEHNDDVDDRIISEIKKCDFALADLTYARPSVYFEAGFAERNVPVIYTCRKDHLSPKADDQYGNFRVHFDLQMKNIISWSDASDHRFSEKLGKRVVRIITPLIRRRDVQKRQEIRKQKFTALSVDEKIRRVFDICVRRIRRAGYTGVEVQSDSLSRWF